MMKSFLLFPITIFCICLFLLGCSGDKKIKVGYLLPSKDRARFVNEGKFMVERFKQLNYDPIVLESNDNDALQIENGYKMLDQGVELMVIAPVNGNTIAPLVREAKKRGVVVIAYNRLINNVNYDMFITGDNFENGKIFCDAALSAKPIGNYVILAGDRFDRNGVELKTAIDSLLKPSISNGNIHIVYESSIENWNIDIARYEFGQVIQSFGTDIDAVIACSDPMAMGTIDVLKKYGLEGKVFVTGQDALIESVKNIYNGSQSLTIYHPHKTLGYKTAELADKILQGDKISRLANASTFNGFGNIPTLKIKSIKVTKDNLDNELIKTGEFTREQITQ
jgi:D-xylose transport system substrate-binding protein